MKVEIYIHEDESNNLQFSESYEIESRIKFIEMIEKIEEIKDNKEDELGAYCTITVSFNWDEAEELEITEEDCGWKKLY